VSEQQKLLTQTVNVQQKTNALGPNKSMPGSSYTTFEGRSRGGRVRGRGRGRGVVRRNDPYWVPTTLPGRKARSGSGTGRADRLGVASRSDFVIETDSVTETVGTNGSVEGNETVNDINAARRSNIVTENCVAGTVVKTELFDCSEDTVSPSDIIVQCNKLDLENDSFNSEKVERNENDTPGYSKVGQSMMDSLSGKEDTEQEGLGLISDISGTVASQHGSGGGSSAAVAAVAGYENDGNDDDDDYDDDTDVDNDNDRAGDTSVALQVKAEADDDETDEKANNTQTQQSSSGMRTRYVLLLYTVKSFTVKSFIVKSFTVKSLL